MIDLLWYRDKFQVKTELMFDELLLYEIKNWNQQQQNFITYVLRVKSLANTVKNYTFA